MKLTAKIRLNPTPEQHILLLDTLKEANRVCNLLSAFAFDQRVFGQFGIHKAKYYEAKAGSQLSSQMIVRCISKVADSYKLDKKAKRTFRPLGSIAYDSRILSFKAATVSIWALGGRQNIGFQANAHQLRLLQHQKGESDLAYVKGKFYLLPT